MISRKEDESAILSEELNDDEPRPRKMVTVQTTSFVGKLTLSQHFAEQIIKFPLVMCVHILPEVLQSTNCAG